MRGSGALFPARCSLVAAAVLAAACSSSGGSFQLFDSEPKTWTESEVKLPPAPKPEHLLAFEAGTASGHRYYIDESSLSVGADEVVRYTLVVRTAGGATNVTYEGIRCQTREHKHYALGRADGSWAPARDSQWRPIEYKDLGRQHLVLYNDFFCPERHVRMATVQQMLAALKQARGNLR